ncbi:hypothetical protein IQ269_20325 [Tychonema sp. LEGE 07199]|uniref:hypothetical protein n=1 Tax=unclassified Tychonema TaxID=2642144 RepID=UPI00188284F6|nr:MULTISPECIES: hypothetical protein [unclassified Tychonema]MBE9123080.1 hypothetical protein [Tychonema sp. LEGE 07199]MBE9132784.1 hypothetical protein [Tychonema sp. LEGE 07196]
MSTQTEIGKILSLEEIMHLYPSEWVLIAYTELDEDLNVIRGEVLAHSPERDLLYNNALSRKGKSVAIEYTGPIPEDLAAML